MGNTLKTRYPMYESAIPGVDNDLLLHDTCGCCHAVMTDMEIEAGKGDGIALCKKCRTDHAIADIIVDDLRRQGR